jgi:hypothetical protein
VCASNAAFRHSTAPYRNLVLPATSIRRFGMAHLPSLILRTRHDFMAIAASV